MGTDTQLDEELRRPAAAAKSLARVRAVFVACAQHRAGEIDEMFPSSSAEGSGGVGSVTLGTWMRMVGWGSLPHASVAEQSDAYERAQATREEVAQRVLNLSGPGSRDKDRDRDRDSRRREHPRAQREAADREAAWYGWQRVGETLWMHRGVPFSAAVRYRRETDTETDTQTRRHADTQTDTQTVTQTDTQTDGHTTA